MTFTLTNNPQSTHTLATDQPLMQANNQYFYTGLGKDHQIVLGHSVNATPGQGTLGEGRHIQVQFCQDIGANPTLQTADNSIGMLWVHSNELWYQNQSYGPVQLTNLTNTGDPVAATDGYTFLPGGLIFQWGQSAIASSGTITTITYPLAFPNAVFSITIGMFNTANNSPTINTAFIKDGTVKKNQFMMTNSSNGTLDNINWMAIGN